MSGLQAQLNQSGDCLTVQGALTLESVPALEKALDSLGWPIRRVELGQVERVDSAALAWLVALARRARENGVSPIFANPPQSLRILVQLYELDFLPFEPKEAA
ncbi:STAS domain-containing protein [Sulfurivirga sp.]|uniref:STAS domain-containing protein n=1 Tax=Sulfurivirga sp. TaxID=2614236 RepID=UPI0025F06F4C|nr:STAS domain-containing protein [Sulfurivirga sp.]